VILKGADVDLSRLPLFLHHDRDGHSYTNDNLVVSKDPDTGVTDWGIYRSMFRTINEKNFDMTCTSHRGRLNALKYQARGQNMPIAIVLGGPTLDKIAALAGVPPETEDFDVLGSFYGAPAELVKCETSDLFVPANAEIVLEGEVMATEGWVYDEGPYGEFTGMYGGGMKHNPRVVIHCMTYRKGAIYQTATIGGAHPGFTDNMLQLPAVESDIYGALCAGGIHVLDVRCPAPGLSNIAYARIKPQGGGDAKQALGIMLTCSKQGLPKIAMVFDADVDIWNDERIAQSMAFRYMPDRDTIIIPQCNTMSTDPKVGDPDKPFVCSKIGLDCTIPLVGDVDRSAYDWSSACDLGPVPKGVVPMDKDALTKDMEVLIRAAPRSWKEILEHYHGQPYRPIYQAFSTLRPRLGRRSDAPWYRYAFLDSGLADATPSAPKLSNHDPRHQPHFTPPPRAA
jgi:4-hydroxy-3-polyprenylbenzoate decarboxylase